MNRILLSAVVLIGWSWQSGQAPTFRARTDTVVVAVAVTQGAKAVTGLSVDDFEILDKGVKQDILDVSYGTLPIDLTLAVDMSDSVRGALQQELELANRQLRTMLQPEDTVRCVVFNQFIREASAACSPGSVPNGSGHTALLDALALSVMSPATPGRRSMVLALTDGQDTVSILDDATVIDVARRSDAAVFTVVASYRPGMLPKSSILQRLSDETGGKVAQLAQGRDLTQEFVRALNDFRASYVLRYELKGVPAPGWHDLTVRVTRRGDFTIRCRRGYQAIQ
jgi:Ca-activated chloride channel family protein